MNYTCHVPAWAVKATVVWSAYEAALIFCKSVLEHIFSFDGLIVIIA